ncbi:MAG: hypothetical protein ABR575_04115 [Actinomycetota bacterium]
MKRLMTLVAAVALVATVPATARAAAVDARVDSPNDMATVEGVVSIRGSATSSAGIRVIEIYIGSTRVKRMEPGGQTSADIAHDWNTVYAPESSTPTRNGGEYKVLVHAVGTDGVQDDSWVRVVVNNPPASPALAAAAGEGGAINLSWSANSEPDFLRYVVERDSGGGFEKLVETQQTTFSDYPHDGQYHYRVTAIRRDAGSGTRSSSSEAVPVTQSAPQVAEPSPQPADDWRWPAKSGARSGRGPGPGSAFGRIPGSPQLPGAAGLPGSAALPGGAAGFPGLPSARGTDTYAPELPYDVPVARAPVEVESLAFKTARAITDVIPGTGLRWLAAGMLMLVAAIGLRLAATRIRVS